MKKEYTCSKCKGKKIIEDENTVIHFFCDGEMKKKKIKKQNNSPDNRV